MSSKTIRYTTVLRGNTECYWSAYNYVHVHVKEINNCAKEYNKKTVKTTIKSRDHKWVISTSGSSSHELAASVVSGVADDADVTAAGPELATCEFELDPEADAPSVFTVLANSRRSFSSSWRVMFKYNNQEWCPKIFWFTVCLTDLISLWIANFNFSYFSFASFSRFSRSSPS